MGLRGAVAAAALLGLGGTAGAVVVDDFATVRSGAIARVDVLENDRLPSGSRVLAVGDGAEWDAAIAADGRTLLIEPGDGFVGELRIPYQAGTSLDSVETGELVLTVEPDSSPAGAADIVEAGAVTLVKVLVLAILLELALHRLFDQRWSRRYLAGRGVKAPVALALALTFVVPFGLDLVGALQAAFSGRPPAAPAWLGYGLTALVVAGAAATIHRLFKAFGLRPSG